MDRDFYDIFVVGVGGQGVLTIADIITNVAFEKGMPVSYYPTKGMAQRGGFVKAQLRLGRDGGGPDIPEGGADLVISMELSESLKAVRYLKKGGEFFLYENKWEPTAVMLGKAPYPTLDVVWQEIENVGGKIRCLSNKDLPEYNGKPVRENIYVLGGLMKSTALKDVISHDEAVNVMHKKWPKGAESNIFTFEKGLEAKIQTEL